MLLGLRVWGLCSRVLEGRIFDFKGGRGGLKNSDGGSVQTLEALSR